MIHVYNLLSFAFFIVAITLLSVSLLSFADRTAQVRATDGFYVVEPQKSFGEAFVGSKKEVDFKFVNRSHKSLLIAGVTARCGLYGCVEPTRIRFPVEVQPGNYVEVPVTVWARKAGDLTLDFVAYTNCPQTPQVGLTVTGRVLENTACQLIHHTSASSSQTSRSQP